MAGDLRSIRSATASRTGSSRVRSSKLTGTKAGVLADPAHPALWLTLYRRKEGDEQTWFRD